MPDRATHRAFAEERLRILAEKLDGMRFTLEYLAGLSTAQDFAAERSRAVISLFHDAFKQFVEAAWWYLNAVHRAGATPKLRYRDAIRKAAAGARGFQLLEAFEAQWQEDLGRRNLLHHNARATMQFQIGGNGAPASFQMNAKALSEKLGEESEQLAQQGYVDREPVPPADVDPLVPRLERILASAEQLVHDLRGELPA